MLVARKKTAVRTLRHFRTAARHGPKAAIIQAVSGNPTFSQ
jgi:hypothetical protein